MKYWRLGIVALAFTACDSGKPLGVSVNLEPKTMRGYWFEVATISPEASCACATYEFTAANEMDMYYNCFDKKQRESIKHTGILEFENNNRIINFNYKHLPDILYNVLGTEAEQSYIMLGTDDRQKLIILSRTTNLAASTIKNLLNKAEELNYNTSRLEYRESNCK